MVPHHDIHALIVDAWEVGKQADLSGVGYGRIHWGNREDIADNPLSYYAFLYGIAASLGATRTIEIGTHWGGSAVAMMRGMLRTTTDPILVTIDVTNESDNFLPHQPESRYIVKLVGDAAEGSLVERVQSTIPSAELIYIDAWKDPEPIVSAVKLYSEMFAPKAIVLDDIRLTDSLSRAWSELQSAFRGRAVDCSEVISEIRPQKTHPGFGLIDLR
jgi:hypothetical protein